MWRYWNVRMLFKARSTVRIVLLPVNCLYWVRSFSAWPFTRFFFLWIVSLMKVIFFHLKNAYCTRVPGRYQSLSQNHRQRTNFTCVLIYTSVKDILACLCQWAWDASFCWCMCGEDAFIAFDILNRKRIAHAQSASVWIVGSKSYFWDNFILSQRVQLSASPLLERKVSGLLGLTWYRSLTSPLEKSVWPVRVNMIQEPHLSLKENVSPINSRSSLPPHPALSVYAAYA
jgi:hypothetical protein